MRLVELANKTKNEIFIDMDGVLVDFFDAWAKLMGKKNFRDIKDIDKGLQAIRDKDDFWLKLRPTPNAGKLLALVRKLKGSYTILSSPLADDPRSEPHKRMWVEKNLKQFPPKAVIITGNKAKYAQQSDGTPNILIDDFGQNIDKWNAAGGIGVKHKDHKFERTFQTLMNHLNKDEKVKERELTKGEEKEKERIVKGMKKNKKDFKKRYGDDAEAVMYATATKMAKENYTRKELPQIKNKHLENIEHDIIFLKINEVITVQKERIIENFKRQVDRLLEGKYAPIVVDCDNRIVNGHHRYDAVRLLGEKTIPVARIPYTLEYIIENFADGKVKGKSRPGRVKRSGASCNGSVSELRKKAKNSSGERAKMYHWCANMKSGRKKSGK